MKRRSYIKNLKFKNFSNFGKYYITLDYFRNGEYEHNTYKIDKPIYLESKVREFINN